MGFLSPWFLGGLLAAGLPIYVHLLRQHKTTPQQFSSLMFFERRTQSSVKHRRLKYLALLAMRLAIILLLALMFANPFVRRSAGAAAGGRKLLIVAVDNSFSMRNSDRLARAKQEALSALGNFRAGDQGQVIAFASRPQLMTQPTEDIAELRAAVQAINPGDGKSAYGELARALRSLANPNGPPIEAHVISDMQKTSLPAPFSELSLGPNTRMLLHPLTETSEPNWFVESVSAPASVFQPKKVRIQATVAGSGTTASTMNVALFMNGKSLESKSVSVPENGRTSLEFFLPDAAYGFNRGEIRIESRDKLAQDDTFGFALERREPSRILFLHESRQPRGAYYFRAAVEAVPDSGFAVDAMQPEQAGNLDFNRYAFVVLSDLSSLSTGLEENLTQYVKQGGSVFIALGAAASARGRVPVINEPIVEARYASREGERFHVVGVTDETHPSVSRLSNFDGVKFYQVVRVDPKRARQVARLSDGVPLLVEAKIGAGKVLVFGSTLDNIANDLPLSPSFIPFIEQTAVYLSGGDPAPPSYVVDSFLELRTGRESGNAVEIIAPGGERPLSLKESATAQTYRVQREGFYEIRRGNGQNELVAVHADRRESDLSVVPKETLALWQNSGVSTEAGGAVGPNGEKPVSLWWYVALALLIAGVVESLFSSRYLQPEEDVMVVRKQAA